jgi:hypothetical protein
MTKKQPCTWEGQGAIISKAIKDEYLPYESIHPGDAERIAAATCRAIAELSWTGAPVPAREYLLNIAKELEEFQNE